MAANGRLENVFILNIHYIPGNFLQCLIGHGKKLLACWLQLEWGLRNNIELPSLEVQLYGKWELNINLSQTFVNVVCWQHDET